MKAKEACAHKKWLITPAAALLVLSGTAVAEVSTNLQTQVITTTKNQIAQLVYVDQDGNPIQAE